MVGRIGVGVARPAGGAPGTDAPDPPRPATAAVIVIPAGPPGAGKTTVAEALQKRLATAGTDVRLVDSDEFSRRIYERMAERVAGSNADWLVAGTFYRSEFFAPFDRFEDVTVVLLWCDLDTHRVRLLVLRPPRRVGRPPRPRGHRDRFPIHLQAGRSKSP